MILAIRAKSRFGGENETAAQKAAQFGGENESAAQLAARKEVQFGSGNENAAQLAAREAAQFKAFPRTHDCWKDPTGKASRRCKYCGRFNLGARGQTVKVHRCVGNDKKVTKFHKIQPENKKRKFYHSM